MQSLYDLYKNLPREQWYYYEGHSQHPFTNPFEHARKKDFTEFIENYFRRSGKVDVLSDSGIKLNDLRYPEHISSVHFLGVLIYNRTRLKDEIDLGISKLGYEFFPFLWFLITLFHDHFYALERSMNPKLKTLDGIYDHYQIKERLLDKNGSNLERLGKLRSSYFQYRSSKDKIDHGISAGIVLYDKLLKIREQMQLQENREFYWGKDLIPKYKMAADAISLHNIWLPQDTHSEAEYEKAGLETLNKTFFNPVKLNEFPLFYLLGIIDTLEPLKAFNCVKDKKYVLENLMIEFLDNSFTIANKEGSILDFNEMKRSAKNFHGWLDVDIDLNNADDANSLTIQFK